ncbi:MAG TPA: hypothetical protein ENG95_05915 [Nitrospirae bacterium]|nr:hypothetical protein [Nitrospirota bacterium]
MKDRIDVMNRLIAELEQWKTRQRKAPHERYYLYYLESNKKHNGGLVICKGQPPNKEYKLAMAECIRRDKTVEENCNLIISEILRLPILSI